MCRVIINRKWSESTSKDFLTVGLFTNSVACLQFDHYVDAASWLNKCNLESRPPCVFNLVPMPA